MKPDEILIICALVAFAVFLFGFIAYVTRGYIQQDRQTDATAPGEPADPCETCNRWTECNGVDREYCPLWRDNEEVTHGKTKGN